MGTALARSWEHWVDLPGRAGDPVGELTGATPGQVIVTDNTTVNLYKLACAALTRGRRLVTSPTTTTAQQPVRAGRVAAQRGASCAC